MNSNVKRKICNVISDGENQMLDILADAVITVLKKLALKNHSDRTTVFSSMTFSEVAENYLSEYGIPITPTLIRNFIRTLPTFIRTCTDECGNPIP